MSELQNAYYGEVAPEREGFIPERGDSRIWYRANGLDKDGVPLLIVHGGPGFSHHYLLSLTDLAADRPVYFYDQSDTGMSDRPGRRDRWNVEHFVDEIETVRQGLGLERFFVLGHSWGGTLVPPYAARHPAGLAGVILASPAVSEPRWAADAIRLRQTLPAEMRERLESHERAGTRDSQEYQETCEAYSARFFCNTDPWPEDILKTFDYMNGEQFAAMWGFTDFGAEPGTSCKGYDGTSHLSAISVPTLFTGGEFDECQPETLRDYGDLVPDSQIEIFAGASHSPQYEVRKAWMDTVSTWMRDVEARSDLVDEQ
ncbi:proline iminopeptidase-family hydrolase [Nocardioides acrostichi]|uniref:Proline iminopeptidase n=1 Tax=Nocardioides acrostichi TaxID=2784339 RepID=A0A930UX82_9ACTN|nr:proline iminopeptidase-family hydrolase [Nocardioides acrostichi]MBF4160735.1 proline iminopeptidase-family hydrolase [Nocardioides acrostichi]